MDRLKAGGSLDQATPRGSLDRLKARGALGQLKPGGSLTRELGGRPGAAPECTADSLESVRPQPT
jgi:hypothetical protein